MNPEITQQTIDLAKVVLGSPNDELAKAYTQPGTATSGIAAYDLEAPAKLLFPVLTPLRNTIPRVSGKGGIQANWRAVTGINTNKVGIGITEGSRGIVTTTATADYIAAYRGLGLDDYVTWEAQYAAEQFQDVRAMASMNLLKALMIGEEQVILGGNASVALGQVGTVTLALSDDAGAVTDSITMYVQVVALTLEAYLASSVVGGIPTSANVTLADGTVEARNGGTSRPSTEVNQATGTGGAANAHAVSASWAVVNGAVAYAVFWGTSTGATKLGAIVTNNSYKILVDEGTGTQLISAIPDSDKSRNTLLFDGFLSIIFNYASTNAYVKTMATGTAGTGTPLTGDGAGGIVEIEEALQSFWDNYRLSPDEIWWSSQEAKNGSDKILVGQSNAAQRFHFITEQDKVSGGVMVRNYYNKFGLGAAQSIPLKIHPYLPPGIILFRTRQLPYPLSNVTNVDQIRCRRDYHSVEWPIRTRRWEMGVYADEVLQHYFPPSLGIIRNIANG